MIQMERGIINISGGYLREPETLWHKEFWGNTSVNPSKNLIIVRLGKNYGHADWYYLLPDIAQSY